MAGAARKKSGFGSWGLWGLVVLIVKQENEVWGLWWGSGEPFLTKNENGKGNNFVHTLVLIDISPIDGTRD